MRKIVEEVMAEENNKNASKKTSAHPTHDQKTGKDSTDNSYTKSAINRELEEVLKGLTTTIKVVGCGGAGTNTISRCLQGSITDVDLIAINTDAQHLLQTNAPHKVLIWASSYQRSRCRICTKSW